MYILRSIDWELESYQLFDFSNRGLGELSWSIGILKDKAYWNIEIQSLGGLKREQWGENWGKCISQSILRFVFREQKQMIAIDMGNDSEDTVIYFF